MSARSEIERHQLSLDSRTRPQYQKRSVSVSQLRSNYTPADIECQDHPDSVVVETLQVPTRRQKSVSVCLATLPSSSSPPRTIEQYEQLTVRNGLPQALSAYDLHEVRLPKLSTSEVFHEPPKMYVYRPRPQVTYPYLRPRRKWSCIAWIKKHKHALTAWIFGAVCLIAVGIIIIFETANDVEGGK